MTTERLLTLSDAAGRCQVCTKTLLRAIHRGELRAYRLGERGAYRIRAHDLDDWIERRLVRPRLRQVAGPVAVDKLPPGGGTAVGRLVVTPRGARSGVLRPLLREDRSSR